ncbi:hypothetical protein ACIQXW_11270 [Lysinibacillus sp. NPDC097162]|uniref:hypothetical protein n=1 Tax=Lysinibacillus sp. NPDC097162 TaxID=3364140 RepID=UPI00382A0BBB
MNDNYSRINEEVVAILKHLKAESAFEGTVLEGKEQKYTVINIADLVKYNSEHVLNEVTPLLDSLLTNIEEGRQVDGKRPYNSYVVINTDEPYINEIISILESNDHWDGVSVESSSLLIPKDEIQEAADLHLQTILDLQCIQRMISTVDDPVNRSIGVALSELEAKFHKIHDKWSEHD